MRDKTHAGLPDPPPGLAGFPRQAYRVAQTQPNRPRVYQRLPGGWKLLLSLGWCPAVFGREPVWLISASYRPSALLRKPHLPSSRWSPEQRAAAEALLLQALAGAGDASRERLYRVNLTLCLERAATPEEAAGIPPLTINAMTARDIGPVELLRQQGLADPRSAEPCEQPRFEDVPVKNSAGDRLWMPVDCRACRPCRARMRARVRVMAEIAREDGRPRDERCAPEEWRRFRFTRCLLDALGGPPAAAPEPDILELHDRWNETVDGYLKELIHRQIRQAGLDPETATRAQLDALPLLMPEKETLEGEVWRRLCRLYGATLPPETEPAGKGTAEGRARGAGGPLS